ncbi:MAG: FAD-dependent thymidylate synthase [Candidatus Woesearchaeota archaeon]|nr:MAG: FAD-dependent thymidylate synthase [Candidatus Woesearchaeota archaeon]
MATYHSVEDVIAEQILPGEPINEQGKNKQLLRDFTSRSEGRLVDEFRGMGRFLGRRVAPWHALKEEGTHYSEDELDILDYFFGNPRSNVSSVRDSMPGDLWGQLAGQYARATIPARDRLLEIAAGMERIDPAMTIQNIAYAIRRSDTNFLDVFSVVAGLFVERYGINYGHASLRDSGTIRMVFEGVSQRLTKLLEFERVGAYQEQSTRAIPFEAENLAIPFEVRGTPFEDRFAAYGAHLIGLYNRALERSKEWFHGNLHGLRDDANEEIASRLRAAGVDSDRVIRSKEWDGVIGAAAFDVARMLIPQFMTTSLAVTLNTRRFQELLTMMQSDPLWEAQLIGRAAQIEALKVSPTLMKYGDASQYQVERHERMAELCDTIMEGSSLQPLSFGEFEIGSKLVSATRDLETRLLASALFSDSTGEHSFADIVGRVASLDQDERRKIALTLLEGMGPHDEFPHALEVGALVFERTYNYGAFRDLQRQRGDRQQWSRYGFHGFTMHPMFENVGMRDEVVAAMHLGRKLYVDLLAAGHKNAAEYVAPMMGVVQHVVTMDPRQQFYQAGLRTWDQGHEDYRRIANDEVAATLRRLPAFQGLVRFDPATYRLNRLPEKVNSIVQGEIKKAQKSQEA